jgi:transposase InsO family protein
VLEKILFEVEVIQTNNGAEFGPPFHYHVLDRGIGHVYIKPATPRLNGKVERSHRIDAEGPLLRAWAIGSWVMA